MVHHDGSSRWFITMVLSLGVVATNAQGPKTHRLEASPTTVAYGHYWSETKPALTINSGDIIDVDTMLTSTPDRLEKSGVPASEIQASLRAIVDQVKDRGPGGHILTGPVYVNGAEPGDALEVKVLSIDLPIAYGYNGCSGYVRENCEQGRPQTIIRLDRKNMTATFLPGVVIPLRPFFGSMGVAPAAEVGRVSSNPPSTHAGNLDNKELVAGTTLFIPVHVRGALFEVGDGHAAQGDGEVDQTGDRNVAPRPPSTDRAQGHEADLAARRNQHAFHLDGHRRRSAHRHPDRDPGDGRLPRLDQENGQASGVSAHEPGG